ncbi:MAG: ABC transporter ATP-binding protein [Chromatiaceae bacterium]|nr:ABC transporter ATP-binding protein [Chromatiaceae bacterium]
MSEVLLKIRNLKTRLGDNNHPVYAVDGVDIEVYRGEVFALLGESGCGKSITALSAMRLLPPSGRIIQGEAWIEGTNLFELPEMEMRRVRGGQMGMIFQEPMTSLNAVIPIGEQIGEAVRLHDSENRENIPGRVVELLRSVGIPDPERRAHEYPHQLSGGMKQRVMIAMALAGKPRLLIADEPTTALDVTIQAQVLSLLRDLQRRTGMAVLLITHDLGVVSEVADRVAVMYAGQIIELSESRSFFRQPAHPYSRKLFDSLPGLHKRGRELAVITGSVPLLNQHFTGCRFLDRCDQAQDICAREAPDWSPMAPGRGVRCHLSGVLPVSRTLTGRYSKVESNDSVGETAMRLDVTGLKVHFPIHQGVFKRVVGHVKAVDGLSLSIASGRTLALVGESGCGKTTAGKGILQLVRPTAGQVCFNGEELTRLSPGALRARRAEMQIIFQDPVASMNPRMLVGDIIVEGMQAQKIGANRSERLARISDLLAQVGLPADAADRYPNEFSGGQRQRICIARALAVDPSFIVCDEPTSALDVSVQAQVLNLLKELQRQRGLAYLFITHNISVVSYLAHEVAVMYLGRIVERGNVDEVLQSPRHPYTQALLSAVPQIDSQKGVSVIRLDGDMPSPANPPGGCHFHPRCSQILAQCKHSYPASVRLSETHSVNCFRVGHYAATSR